ncbi:MAG: FlgD immunoglobulin-like domain containing protein [bacterium]
MFPRRLAASLLPFLASPVVAAVPTYSTFELQARSEFVSGYNLPAGSSFNSGTPTLNDDATLSFRLIVVGNTGNAGLWVGAGGSGGVVYHAPANWLLSDPTINSAGKVVFEQADIGISDGVLLYDPVTGNTTQRVAPGGIYGINSFGSPQINDSDVVGFRANQGSQYAYFFDTAGTQTPVAVMGGGVAYLFSPQFNNSSQFAAKVRLGTTAEASPDEIRRYQPNGLYLVMAEDDDSNPLSPFTSFQNGVGFSNSGLVAFVANAGGGTGVYLANGSSVIPIATTADPDVSGIDFFAPVVNDAGLVAFRGYDAAGLRAIFAGDGTTLRRVIGEHDLIRTDLGQARIDQHDSSPVFGGTVDINSHGDIAFAATLTPPDDNQIEWGTGMFIAYADGDVSAPTPAVARLAAPSPNPFVERTTISFRVPRAGIATVDVYDVSGRRLRTLASGPVAEGTHDVVWDGLTSAGVPAPAGVYFVRLTSPGETPASRRVVRLRDRP